MASKKNGSASHAEAGRTAPESAQRPVLDFLLDPATHGVAPAGMARIDTHIATVVLAGTRAYKMKRAVKLSFVDFSSLRAREAACRAELRLNRRTAPEIYRDVIAVTRGPDGRFHLGGEGAAVEWLVAMRRFDDSRLLDRLARTSGLAPTLALDLAAVIAGFHEAEPPVQDGADAAELERLIRQNVDELRDKGLFDAAAVATLARRSLAWLAAAAGLVAARRRQGRVRHCHGDLHLRNIFLDGDRPVLFDALEFDERLAKIDVLYDLAFLLMDLWHRDMRGFANALFNRYLLLTGDWGGLALLPLFLSMRAAIRAHVTASVARSQPDAGAGMRLQAEAKDYLALALDLLAPATPCLIAVGGFSGSGKSTLARGLAPRLAPAAGAVLARSDEIRKRLWGVEPEARLPDAAYAPSVSSRVYAEMRRIAGLALAAGYTAVIDAVHDRGGDRRLALKLAQRRGVGFHGFWLEAPAETMARRIGRRRGDASDATAAVLRAQLATGSRPLRWHRLHAEAGAAAVQAEALERLAQGGVDLLPG
jgi:uncharacterized protein